jgi:hypothetical protein
MSYTKSKGFQLQTTTSTMTSLYWVGYPVSMPYTMPTGLVPGREHGITSREARTLPKLICLEYLFYLHLRPDSVAVYLVRQ